MQLPSPKEHETAFGYYHRLIDIIGDKTILSKEEKTKVSNALYESLEASLGQYHLKDDALNDLIEANNLL